MDRCLGRRVFAAALLARGLRVEMHDDHFDPTASDEEWLSEVGRRGWVVVTRDLRIRYRTIERNAALSNGVRMISLTARNLTASQLGKAFAESADRIDRFLAANPQPFIAALSRGGEIRIVAKAGDR